MLDHVREARIFTTLHLRVGYDFIRIKEGDEYKTAFRTCYGQFLYRVMPFGPTNAQAIFQSDINDCPQPYIDDFIVCYLDDILISSTNKKEHEEHVREVLKGLREFRLYCRAENCQFRMSEVGFVQFDISPDGVGMKSVRISAIEDRPTPKSH